MSETRDLLLDLGERAVRTRGFAGFSYADLARDAGIRKASIHHHFPAKADLAYALIERYAVGLAKAFAAIETNADSAGKALLEAIEVYRAAIEDGASACLCAALATDTALLTPESRDLLETTNEETRKWFAGIFEAGTRDGSIATTSKPEDHAAATLALLQGAQLLAKSASNGRAFDQAVLSLKGSISG